MAVAGRDVLELIGGELLGQGAHEEFDGARLVVGLDSGDGEPQEELLGLDSGDVGDGSVGKLAGDEGVVIDEAVEVDVAGASELDAEGAVIGEGVGLDGVGENTLGEAVFAEQIVDARIRSQRIIMIRKEVEG